jgi:hypothetical protein
MENTINFVAKINSRCYPRHGSPLPMNVAGTETKQARRAALPTGDKVTAPRLSTAGGAAWETSSAWLVVAMLARWPAILPSHR